MLKIRGATQEDVQNIDGIWQLHQEAFGLPDTSNSLTTPVIERDGNVIGYGIVKLLAEAIMILDLKERKRDRLQAMELLMQEAIRSCKEKGILQLHVFVKDPSLVKLLDQKYAFRVVSDTVMVLEV